MSATQSRAFCRSAVAWNLAGGYQNDLNKVIEIHVNTARACEKYFGGISRI